MELLNLSMLIVGVGGDCSLVKTTFFPIIDMTLQLCLQQLQS